MANCFRVELRDSYIHDAAWAEPVSIHPSMVAMPPSKARFLASLR
jgi:hypothetical protein